MIVMEAIFHEQQDGSLCAQHCLNSLLQGQFYSAVDLADMASELDTLEKLRMAEMGEDTPEYRQFLEQPSTNMDDSGFFSVQVISKALSVWGLELLPLNSSNPAAVRAKTSPISASAYICNFREHWFTIRRLGSQWFNLNSLLEGPELVSNTYLGEFLAQLQHEGYDIFLVTGEVSCDELRKYLMKYCFSCPPVMLTWCCRLSPPLSWFLPDSCLMFRAVETRADRDEVTRDKQLAVRLMRRLTWRLP